MKHIHTDKCGFDRNVSLLMDTYVCACGWYECEDTCRDCGGTGICDCQDCKGRCKVCDGTGVFGLSPDKAKRKRITLRAIERNSGKVEQIIEQEIPATTHEIGLFLRRYPFRQLAALALLRNGSVTIEVKPHD